MENLCDKCKQENCPRCIERFKERFKWTVKFTIGVLILWKVAKIAYLMGEVDGRMEKDSNEDQEGEDSTDNEEDSTDDVN